MATHAGASGFNYEHCRYDGHGRRVLAWTPAGSKLTMYSSSQPMYQHSDPKSKTIEKIYLGGSLVASRETPFGGATIVKYQHTDALGSPVAVTNQAGAVIERIDYDPYGGLINGSVDGVGYTGHVMDPTTGLTYMQQRYYDPALGQFLSVDPVTAHSSGDGRHLHRHSYAFNNPYKFSDPDGRKPKEDSVTGSNIRGSVVAKGMISNSPMVSRVASAGDGAGRGGGGSGSAGQNYSSSSGENESVDDSQIQLDFDQARNIFLMSR